ncbi:magnesium transporter CorA family protein [Roseivivax isoporae]|uniref:Magnesium transport protein CorA n=1 Tax=Roseivivax isoporae LMG 25204 TaxID=1449351 RepID=X7F5Q0_9RHOB|nr:magnesium transporter CorA family protein [Roseivivax isoporae]ETX28257.1 magnesium transporter [Roseivivax isoporae LMG 25204]
MIRGYALENGALVALPRAGAGAVWLDLAQPGEDERALAEDLAGLPLPRAEEMEEIEISSRLYARGETAVMTAILPARTEDAQPVMAPVSFVLTPDRLVTVRHHAPRAFETFPDRATRGDMAFDGAGDVTVSLLEAVVDRLADILERLGGEIDTISRGVFSSEATVSRDFQDVLERIGRKGELASNIRDSLVTLDRLARFLGQVLARRSAGKDLRERTKTLSRDIRSLLDHAGFLSQKITFLLDATLGMISIEQNAIIKIFSVAAVMFLPPTLIASIYGMNFQHMPELGLPFGYPMALGAMVVSAILPYLYFRRRGWL